MNLNSAAEIDSTINPDRTMGPKTSQGNFSNLLPSADLGNVEISVSSSNNSNVLSLALVISKVEVHLARLFIPGGNSNTTSSEGINGQRTNQNVNKWETLQLGGNIYNPVIVRLENGFISSLGYTRLAGGKYSEIRLYVSKATAKLVNGKEVEFVLPGGESIIRVVRTFNIDVTSENNIALTKKNSFSLESGWSDKDVLRLLQYIKDEYLRIKVEPRIVANFWQVGSNLKRSLI